MTVQIRAAIFHDQPPPGLTIGANVSTEVTQESKGSPEGALSSIPSKDSKKCGYAES